MRGADRVAADAQAARDAGQRRLVDRPAAADRRRGEGQPRAVAARDPDPLGTFIAQRPKSAAPTTTSLAAPAAAVRREKAAQDADVELIAALLALTRRC